MLVVNDICRQVVTKRKIEMLSHPLVVRDFISIKSICNSISSLIIKRGSIDEDILHVVSSKTITLLELTNIVADRSKVVLGYKPSVIFKDSVPISKSNFKISNLKLSQFIDVSKMGLVDEIDDLLLKTASWFN